LHRRHNETHNRNTHTRTQEETNILEFCSKNNSVSTTLSAVNSSIVYIIILFVCLFFEGRKGIEELLRGFRGKLTEIMTVSPFECFETFQTDLF